MGDHRSTSGVKGVHATLVKDARTAHEGARGRATAMTEWQEYASVHWRVTSGEWLHACAELVISVSRTACSNLTASRTMLGGWHRQGYIRPDLWQHRHRSAKPPALPGRLGAPGPGYEDVPPMKTPPVHYIMATNQSPFTMAFQSACEGLI